MGTGFTRILVPTDFSPASTDALVSGKMLARTFGAELHVVHVLDDPFVGSTFAADAIPPSASMRDAWRAAAEKELAHALSTADRAELRTATQVLFGPPSQCIVNYAAEHAVDLIVMGTHGRGAVAHLLLGSVAERVVRTATCPVLTVRMQAAT